MDGGGVGEEVGKGMGGNKRWKTEVGKQNE